MPDAGYPKLSSTNSAPIRNTSVVFPSKGRGKFRYSSSSKIHHLRHNEGEKIIRVGEGVKAIWGDLLVLFRNILTRLVDVYRHNRNERRIARATGAIVCGLVLLHVFTLIVLKLGYDQAWTRCACLRLDEDGSYAELFNYAQVGACAFLLGRCFRLTGERMYIGWALVFLFIVLDDSLMLHERFGEILTSNFVLPVLPGLRGQDTGELIVWGAMSVLLLPPLIYGLRAKTRESAGFAALFAIIFAALVFFAVGVDMLSIAVGHWSRYADELLAIVEDGGEIVVMAVAFVCSLLLHRHLISVAR
jgi:hypothetical protein